MNRSLAFLLFLAATSAVAREHPYPRADRIDARVSREMARSEIVGLAIVVIDEGKIAWMKGYGLADREKQVPIDPATTQFRWASISKSVTAIAALQLAEKGLLDLDADVRSYVPEFPDKGVKITARDLLRHQGGIVHYTNGPIVPTLKLYADPHPFANVIVALDRFKDSPLVNRPGTRYAYSSHGYILLSAVIERAGKQRFADQVKERISQPLGMADFRPDYQWEDIPYRAAGYTREDKKVRRRTPDQDEDVSWKLGGGGFTSPAMDLADFGLGLIQQKLVSKETERLMWTVNRPSDPEGAKPYGLGFFVIDFRGGGKLVGHDGSQARTKTALLLDPQNKKGIAIMTNSEWVDAMKLAASLMDEIR